MNKQKPLLSIGIIFKNEIRCLERCLKSLEPLREAVPCELVMADTGADDGSREVAEQYADILIDFPWINDFAAARNAVMDRCSGKWYVTLDADEWLDKDVSQLSEFLAAPKWKEDCCILIIRNYTSYSSNENYSDFFAARMVRMSAGMRYEGAIHEAWNKVPKTICVLNKTVLHHDGYVGMDSEQGRKKRARNMALLREELNKSPDDMRRRLQCLESSVGDPDHGDYVRLAVEGVKRKLPRWEKFGPAIFRGAVIWAAEQAIEELGCFVEDARALFPDSMFTRLDIENISCRAYFKDKNYEKAILSGEAYLRAMADYHANRLNLADMMDSAIGSVSPLAENNTRLLLAESYFQIMDFQKSMERLTAAEFDKLPLKDFKDCVGIMLNLQAQSGLELSGHMLKLWNYLETLNKEDPNTEQRMNALTAVGSIVFPQSYRDTEAEKGFRHAYTIFLPLAGKFEMGTAAQILETTDAGDLEGLLGAVKNWNEFPIHALAHALKYGVRFPLPERPLKIEEMDALAARLAQNADGLRLLVEQSIERGLSGNIQEFVWTRGLVLAAVRRFGWSSEDVDVEQGMALICAFMEVEKKYLPLCYAHEAMQEEKLFILPSLHRFGFYSVRAFDALGQGDTTEYVRLLRAGLADCESAKEIVEFLVEHTPELQTRQEPSAELRTLAEQIRTVLANFAPDNPAVIALKQSEAYQKVAYLIEGASVPVVGGLLQ